MNKMPSTTQHVVTLADQRPHKGYIRAACSCGWKGSERDPYLAGQYAAARDEAARHIKMPREHVRGDE